MPIDLDIHDHEVLGPIIIAAEKKAQQKGHEQGLQAGLQAGVQAGVQAGQLALLRRLIEKRFGALPPWAAERLEAMPAAELENLSERVLDAGSLDDLFA